MSKGASTTTATVPEYQKRQQEELFQAAKVASQQPFVQALELLDLIQINYNSFKPLAVYLKLVCNMTHSQVYKD